MNVLPCEVRDGSAFFRGSAMELAGRVPAHVAGRTEIGIRPEYVRLGAHGIPATVRKAADVGRHIVVETRAGDTRISAIVDGPAPAEGETVHLDFERSQTRLYADGWLVIEEAAR